MKETLKKIIYLGLPLILIYFVFIRPFLTPGLVVGGDWITPYSPAQLKYYGETWNRLWNNYTLPTGSQIPHKNLFLYELLIYGFSFTGISGFVFQKIFISFLVLLIFFSGLLLFYRITKNLSASIIGALIYLFSPIVFNYFVMGWVFVLLFIGLMPLFIFFWLNFVEENSYSSLIGLSVVSAIAFFQSQSIFWIPLLLVVCSLSYLSKIGRKKSTIKFFICCLAVGTMTVAIHASWYYPVSLFPEKIITASTSANDIYRFSTVSGLPNQLIGWGSLWNEPFELSFTRVLKPLVYLPVIGLILLIIIHKKDQKSHVLERYFFLSLFLVLVAPFFYIFRYQLANLPLSVIIRDSSRFIIFTNLGLALSISLLWEKIKNRGMKFCFLIVLILLIHPYLFNRLTTPRKFVSGVSEFSKDQRLRVLEIPWKENGELIEKEKPQRGIYFPTGGFVTAKTDPRFKVSFSWIGDLDTFYTPSVSGFLISDKSNSKTERFTKYYLDLADNDKETFRKISQIYGIDKVFVRRGLIPTDSSSPDYNWTMEGCEQTELNSSDWSIGKVCAIPDPYPLLFASSNLQVASTSAYYNGIKQARTRIDYLVSIDCDEQVDNGVCKDLASQSLKKKSSPEVAFKSLGPTKYEVNVGNISSDFVLVLNQTYHPGWVISNDKSRELAYEHFSVNQLVNGWFIPGESSPSARFIIEFYPDVLYKKLLKVSLGVLIAAILGAGVLYYFEKRKQP